MEGCLNLSPSCSWVAWVICMSSWSISAAKSTLVRCQKYCFIVISLSNHLKGLLLLFLLSWYRILICCCLQSILKSQMCPVHDHCMCISSSCPVFVMLSVTPCFNVGTFFNTPCITIYIFAQEKWPEKKFINSWKIGIKMS